MVLLKRKRAGPLVMGLVGLVLSLSAGRASAVTDTWTVTPGGQVTAQADRATFTDTKTGTVLTCASSQEATYRSGSGLSGTDIAAITSTAFTNCTGPGGLAFTITAEKLPWFRNAVSYDASTGVTTGIDTGVFISLSAPGCSAIVAGATATTAGKYSISYINQTGELEISGGGTLHIWNVNGCFGLLNIGDAITFSSAYAISPRQIITSP